MSTELKAISKEELIKRFHEIESLGWIENTARKTNDGAAGNMLEDLLGIPENNLPIPNAAEWELKTQKDNTTSLVTLFHQEPSPLALKVVSSVLLPYFGWKHKEAGKKYPETEKSFRTTLSAGQYTRGFTIEVNDKERKVCVKFNESEVKDSDNDWLEQLKQKQLTLTPYWGFDDLFGKARIKLRNCFLVIVETKKIGDKTFFHFYKALMLKSLNLEKFIEAIRSGKLYIDFDARTGHNHGTKFRIMPQMLTSLYEDVMVVMDKTKKQ